MTISLLLSIYLLLQIALAVFAGIKRKALDVFPSCVWAFIMGCSFLVQRDYFIQEFLASQAYSIVLVGVALGIGDLLGVLKNTQIRDAQFYAKTRLQLFGYALLVISLVLQVLHIAVMPQVPLWELLLSYIKTGQPLGEAAARDMREYSSKLLPVPALLIYLFQYSLMIFTPIALSVFIYLRKWRLFAFLFFVSLIYSRMTLAKGPVYTLLVVTAVPLWFFMGDRTRKMLRVASIVLIFSLVLLSAITLRQDSKSIFGFRDPRAEDIKAHEASEERGRLRAFTLADYMRLREFDEYERDLQGKFERQVNFFIYRVFLVPAEVSSRWYVYYPRLKGDWLYWSGITRPATPRVPANEVGVWAYTQRFPRHYGDSISAFASADADAHARFGLFGVGVIAFVVFGLRSVVTLFSVGDYIGRCLKAFCLLYLGIILPMASVQALLIAQGYFSLLVLVVIYYYVARLNKCTAVNVDS